MNFFPYYDYNLGLLDCFLEKSLVVCTSIDDFESEDFYEVGFDGVEQPSEEFSQGNSEEVETESGIDQVESSVSGNSSSDGIQSEDSEGRQQDLQLQLSGYSVNESSATYIQSSENLTIDYSSYFENLQNIGIVLIAAILAGFASMAFMKGFKK